MGAEIAITVVASKLIDKAVNKLIDKLIDKRATTLRLNMTIPLNNLANECVNLLHNFSTFFLFKKSMNLPKELPVDLTMNASANQNTNLRLSIEVKQLSKQVSDATGTLNILQEIDFKKGDFVTVKKPEFKQDKKGKTVVNEYYKITFTVPDPTDWNYKYQTLQKLIRQSKRPVRKR